MGKVDVPQNALITLKPCVWLAAFDLKRVSALSEAIEEATMMNKIAPTPIILDLLGFNFL